MTSRSFFAWRMIMEAQKQDLINSHRESEAIMRSLMDPVNDLSEGEFKKRYRLTKAAFKFLCNELRLYTDLRSSQRVNSEYKILSALSFYATGSYQRSVGEGKHLSQEAMSNYVNEVTKALNSPPFIRQIIQFPTTHAARERIKQKFFQKHGIPGVIGCIDGCHFRIFTPKKELEHMYYCRKHFHSLNVQMVCDSECRILAVNSKFGGAAHDAFIWDNSMVNDYMQTLHQTDSSCWLLGDSGYPLRPWIMTPYASPVLGSAEANYNTIHGSARVVIENTFGRLKNRWRCCIEDRVLHYSPDKCAQIITACCVLHNIALDFRVLESEEEHADVEEFRRNETVAEERGASELLRGYAQRNQIARRLMS